MTLYRWGVLHLSGTTVPSPPWKAAPGAFFSFWLGLSVSLPSSLLLWDLGMPLGT